jgi:DNA-binding transcriptional regulator YiaG
MKRYAYRPVTEINGEHPLLSIVSHSGDTLQTFSQFFRPRPSELRRMLHQVRDHHRESLSACAIRYGVSRSTIIKWASGRRAPSGAAARIIWIVWTAAFNPDAISDYFSWAVWQRPCVNEWTPERLAEYVKERKRRNRKKCGRRRGPKTGS